MNCLLVAATAAEISPFLKHYRTSNKKDYIDFNLHILVTGVGTMATTYHLTRYLYNNQPDMIVMIGIAGCFDQSIPLGTVLAVQKDVIADMGVTEKGKWVDMFDLGLMKPNKAPFYNKMLLNKNKDLLARTKLKAVSAITVNEITTHPKRKDVLQKKYSAILESMEGAALHYVCNQAKIPYVQIRGVSNYIGERNKKKWAFNEAIQNSNQVLIHLFESL